MSHRCLEPLRVVQLVLVALFVLFAIGFAHAQSRWAGGTIIPKEGQPIHTDKLSWSSSISFTGDDDYGWRVIGTVKGDDGRFYDAGHIYFADLEHVRVLAPEALEITTKKGTTFRLHNPTLPNSGGLFGNQLAFARYGAVDGRLVWAGIRWADIAEIYVDAEVGTLKTCPDHNRVFPADYRFCPYCGAELVWCE